MERWSINDSAKIYNLPNWGADLFSINKKGNVCVHPSPTSKHSIDLRALVDDLIKRKIKPPILLRFMDVLQGRIAAINRAFKYAIDENDYPSTYQTFYPIKVNQQRQVVEAIAKFGKRYNIGIEVGSKPELVIGISFATGNGIPIICNGYKDKEYIETVLYATKIGYDITIVVEKMFELEKIIALSKKTGIKPKLGIRVKLSSKGTGKWATSGGEDAKFGLRMSEIIAAIGLLEQNELLDSVKLIHFHIGSQITKIDKIKSALIEGTRVYAEMRKLGVGIEYVDIGGGLGVDYDGSKSSYFSSVNYSIEEYANDVIYQIKNICEDAGVECPNIISESGRATAAHYSVLVTNLLNTNTQNLMPDFEETLNGAEKLAPTVKKLVDIYKSIDRYSLREDYHDTVQLIQEAVSLFSLGYLTLAERAMAEWLHGKILRKINGIVEKIKPIPEELQNFQLSLRQTYFANFSLFQSIPDSWAIDQLFPIVPIQRLNQKPDVMASIADITCDSDGEITSFVGENGRTKYLPLHKIRKDEDYFVGFFLIGAYQEILGDMHNLFGDTNAVHVTFNKKTGYKIDTVINGDATWESLKYVQYKGPEILKHVRDTMEKDVALRKVSIEESSHFLELLDRTLLGYTYLGE
ncbi:arginine decarboxylase [Geobacter metallireducens RCH3]|uniref:Biosynthetic arginine decarboxylase n=1 Tax=Geobacter metallireducens (strain ATCC 53774 / DSM 7210 / GS-15) TaxID=269799 RepID=SPEA_GEOMG|nr:arginine decarboxylase [Geobacter metallireducens]Q39X78.1 RecName: Full=Biosynthetic arginine decarboxylase; Short=ADC [Geobacter metallireducens GS-15]ABB31146.1 arginine decarboxylase, biosynthetic type [Geobacter metallireducens GS-15]EHP85324.1 arginine decarboxylase [Geobacter metallireducens RCH3]